MPITKHSTLKYNQTDIERRPKEVSRIWDGMSDRAWNQHVNLPKGCRIYDSGCGEGRLFEIYDKASLVVAKELEINNSSVFIVFETLRHHM